MASAVLFYGKDVVYIIVCISFTDFIKKFGLEGTGAERVNKMYYVYYAWETKLRLDKNSHIEENN